MWLAVDDTYYKEMNDAELKDEFEYLTRVLKRYRLQCEMKLCEIKLKELELKELQYTVDSSKEDYDQVVEEMTNRSSD